MDTMPQNAPRKYNYLITVLIVSILIVICGIVYGFYLLKNTSSKSTTDGASFFDAELVTVSGKVTQVNNNLFTIENKKGIKRSFPVSPAVTVLAPSDQGLLTSSNDLSKVELGKPYLLSLSLGAQGTLEITTFMPESAAQLPPTDPQLINVPSPTPVVATRSAVPSPKTQENDDTSEE